VQTLHTHIILIDRHTLMMTLELWPLSIKNSLRTPRLRDLILTNALAATWLFSRAYHNLRSDVRLSWLSVAGTLRAVSMWLAGQHLLLLSGLISRRGHRGYACPRPYAYECNRGHYSRRYHANSSIPPHRKVTGNQVSAPSHGIICQSRLT
jgi:hypothetical protein